MPDTPATIRLLLLHDSQNEAERLTSLLRNAGHAVRSQRVACPESFTEALQQPWDLLLAAPHNERIDLRDVLEQLRRQQIDLPCLQLVDNPAAVLPALQRGAEDGIPRGADEHLLLAVRRTLDGLGQRRARQRAERALAEAERCRQLLLDSSTHAIAYVHDGMHIHVNPAYAALFGHADGEEVACLPLVDLIDGETPGILRDLLKQHTLHGATVELACRGRRADGERFRARLLLSPATFEGEPCLQVIVTPDSDSAELEERLREVSRLDTVTGLYNRQHLLERLERQCAAGQRGSLVLLRIEHYPQLLAEIGLAEIDPLRATCAARLSARCGGAPLGRIADDTFAALFDSAPDATLASRLRELREALAGEVVEVGTRSLRLALSIGAAPLEPDSARVLERAHRCCEQAGAEGGVRLFDPAEELAAAASRGDRQAMLQQALDSNAFELLFQPVIGLHGDGHEHYQTHLRLQDARGCALPLEALLAAAAHSPLPARIERWQLLQAMRRLAARGARSLRTRLFITLGAASLLDEELPAWLERALAAARLPGEALILQFDEALATAQLRPFARLAAALAPLGCQLGVRDFGRQPEPLDNLRHLPASYLHLAPPLLEALDEAPRLAALRDLSAALHGQQRRIVAAGVDSAAQLASLWQSGVHYVQGDYLHPPGTQMDYDFETGQG